MRERSKKIILGLIRKNNDFECEITLLRTRVLGFKWLFFVLGICSATGSYASTNLSGPCSALLTKPYGVD